MSSAPPADAEKSSPSLSVPELSPTPPVLASDVMRDEVAPVEPEGDSCRIWFAALALSLALLGGAMWQQSVADVIVAFGGAVALLALAAAPFPYVRRAALAATVGLSLMILGLFGAGPLAALAADANSLSGIELLPATTLLPAALLFRSHYREYRRARLILAVALTVALPLIISQVGIFADTQLAGITRISSLVTAVTLMLSSTGFMAGDTKAAASLWAALAIASPAASLALAALTNPPVAEFGPMTYIHASIGLIIAATASGVGLYQLLAARFGDDARRMTRALSQRPNSFSRA